MKHKFLIAILCCVINSVSAQVKNEILVDPPFWWIGMKDTTLQLMIHANEISSSLITTDSKNLKITKTKGGDSRNYLFVDLVIPKNCLAGNYNFELTNTATQKKNKI
jgi:hypothetical protein